MKRMQPWILALLTGVIASTGPVEDVHATAIYSYVAPCILSCDQIGLAPGGLITGTVGIDDSAIGPYALVTLADVQSFDFQFGTLHFGLPDLAEFLAVLDGTGSSALALLAEGFSPHGFFLLGNDAVTVNIFIAGASFDSFAVGAFGSLVRVPEPGTLLLLLAGMAGLMLSRRRQLARCATSLRLHTIGCP